jgi:hypothetical protein
VLYCPHMEFILIRYNSTTNVGTAYMSCALPMARTRECAAAHSRPLDQCDALRGARV